MVAFAVLVFVVQIVGLVSGGRQGPGPKPAAGDAGEWVSDREWLPSSTISTGPVPWGAGPAPNAATPFPASTGGEGSLGGIDLASPVHVQFDFDLLADQRHVLAVEDLRTFFLEELGVSATYVDDSQPPIDNAVLLGAPGVNDAVGWLVDSGHLTLPALDEPGSFWVGWAEWGAGYEALVVAGADPNGDLRGTEWLLDRLRTQTSEQLASLDDLVSPRLSVRQNAVVLSNDAEFPSTADSEEVARRNFEAINQSARQMCTGVTLFGPLVGQYPELLNYSGLDVPGLSLDPEVQQWKKAVVAPYVDYALSLGLEVYFWADQLNFVDPAVASWLREGGDVDFDNPRLVQFLQYQATELFASFPGATGIHWRVGDDLYAALSYRLVDSPESFRAAATTMMGVLEPMGKKFILRTWQMSTNCVHASPEKYEEAFGGLYWPGLVISVKYTPSDYQRFPLNPTINEGALKQVVEFQAMTSFENYQFTPNYLGEWYQGVFEEALAGRNATGGNTVAGLFSSYVMAGGPSTPNLEGPGSQGSFRWDYNSYYLTRAGLDPLVNATDVAADFGALALGKSDEARELAAQWLPLTGRAHFDLLYVRGHREASPWLKVHLFHYTRAFRAAPDVAAYVYHHSRDVDDATAGLGLGLQEAVLARELGSRFPDVAGPSAENQAWAAYLANASELLLKFANLTYWFSKALLEYYAWMDTLRHDYRERWEASLPRLKAALEDYDDAYHYYHEPERGHQAGVEQVRGFVSWLEAVPEVQVTAGFVAVGWALVVALAAFAFAGGDRGGTRNAWFETFRRPSRVAAGALVGSGRVVAAGAAVAAAACLANGLLLTCATYFTRPVQSFWLGVSASAAAYAVVFVACASALGPRQKRHPPASRLRASVSAAGTAFVALVPLQVAVGAFVALKTPMGAFTGRWVAPVLFEARFEHYTPVGAVPLALLVLGLATPFLGARRAVLALSAVRAGGRWRGGAVAAFLAVALGSVVAAALVLLGWFPGLLSDVDFYVNSALGIHSPVEFYS
ncbi:MAG: hypothetical protein Kow0069_29270 [Promethearchaeota archaeon]